MLKNKNNYIWYVCLNLFFGLSVFTASLVVAIAGPREVVGERQLYFGREILPDHVFYPMVALGDRMELWAAPVPDRVTIQTELARKRLSAAHQLYTQGKIDLAWVTLRKAHQYALEARSSLQGQENSDGQALVTQLNQDMISEYTIIHKYMPDSQWASVTRMIDELKMPAEGQS